MSTHLWKVTATRDNLTVKKGMSAEIVIKNFSGKPNAEQIRQALNVKYGDVKSGSVSLSFFEIVEL